MKTTLLSILVIAITLLFAQRSFAGGKETKAVVYGFKVAGLEGGTIDLAQFKGKKILIVNTASECGYTPQYEGLEKLYKANKGRLVIIGFPSNDFGAQEPGDNKAIAGFCKKNYGVTFPMAAKVVVKGDRQIPLYRWLTHKSENGFQDSEVKWNFNKYLIDEEGHLIGVFPSSVTPQSDELAKAIAK